MGLSPHTRPPTTPALPTSARRTLTSSCRPTVRSPVCRAQTGMCKCNYKRPTNVTPGIPDCCPDVSFTEGILFRGGGPHFDLFHPRRPSSSLCHEIIPWHSEAFVFQPTWSLQGLVAGRKVTSCFFHLLFMLLGFSVCLWQLFQQPVGVPGQVRRVCVQTGRQSLGCNDERRAFQIPEGDGASKCNILSISSCLL